MQDLERVPALTKKKRKKRANRFILWLGWFFLIGLCAVLFFRSPLSKIDTIEVMGNDMVSTSQIIQISELSKGNSFFTVHRKKIEAALISLPEIKTAAVESHFPGKVSITIEENKRIAYMIGEEGNITPVLENGIQLENRNWNDRFIDKPLIREWEDKTMLTKLAIELKKVDPSVLSLISEIKPASKEDPLRLVLFMKDGYEVQTSIRNFAKNMNWYPAFVANLMQEGNPKGVIMLFDGKWFIPYENPVGEDEEKVNENS